jgi:HlyD family secretion protein
MRRWGFAEYALRETGFDTIIIRMINNERRIRALPFFLVITNSYGCIQAHADAPAPFQGVVEYDNRVVGFDLGGRVVAVNVQRGESVRVDSPIARLDDSLEKPLRDLRAAELSGAEAQLRLLRAGARGEEIRASESEVSSLRAQEAILQKNLLRQQTLVQQSALAQSVPDDTAAQLQSTGDRRHALEERLKALRSGARGDEIAGAAARVAAATAALAAQDARLAHYEVRALSAGSVIDVHIKVGEVAAPLTPVVTIADLDHPYVDVFVPQARAHLVHVGDALQVRVDGVAASLAGSVEHIFPGTEFTPRFLFSEGERPNLVIRTRVRIADTGHVLHAGIPAFVATGELAHD